MLVLVLQSGCCPPYSVAFGLLQTAQCGVVQIGIQLMQKHIAAFVPTMSLLQGSSLSALQVATRSQQWLAFLTADTLKPALF